MNVSQIYGNRHTSTLATIVNQSNNRKAGLDNGKRDTVEISAAAYERNVTGEKMTATSGKDILGIKKGDKDNSFVIHFSDSAIVNRAVSRGYITVNGIEIRLSEETKQQLLKTDEQAKAEREKAYKEYVMQHEKAVAKQQSETWKKAFDSVTDTVDILDEILGKKVMSKQYENAAKAYKNTQGGVSWSQFEWKTYDTQMKISVEDTVKFEDISKGEIIIKMRCIGGENCDRDCCL